MEEACQKLCTTTDLFLCGKEKGNIDKWLTTLHLYNTFGLGDQKVIIDEIKTATWL